MYVAIVGSRDFPDRKMVEDFVWQLPFDTVVVSGGARGVDDWAARAAFNRGLKTHIINAEWDKYGKSAGFRRNELIVAAAQVVVAFWDGKSRGTANTIELARKAGKPVDIRMPLTPR